jgi:hypothetical protein
MTHPIQPWKRISAFEIIGSSIRIKKGLHPNYEFYLYQGPEKIYPGRFDPHLFKRVHSK